MIEVTNWEEFLSAIQQNADSVKLMNDIVASEITSAMQWYCLNFDGNNHKIIGLKADCHTFDFMYTESKYNPIVKNLDFVNITIGNYNLFSFTNYAGMTFENCRFNGILKGAFINDYSYASHKANFKKCSFAFRGYDARFVSGTNKKNVFFENCDIMLYGTWNDFCTGNFTNSKLSGGIINGFTPADNVLMTSVIDCTCLADITATVTNCVYNSEKATFSNSAFIPVTSEYLSGNTKTDAEKISYFNSVGFEVFEDVDSA